MLAFIWTQVGYMKYFDFSLNKMLMIITLILACKFHQLGSWKESFYGFVDSVIKSLFDALWERLGG